MQFAILICAVVCINGGGGVTRTPDLSKLWTDEYNIFQQIYGKTSDKDLYGSILPSPSSEPYGVDLSKLIQNEQAQNIRENLLKTLNLKDVDTSGSDMLDSYAYGDPYSNLLTKQSLINFALKENANPNKSVKFVGVPDAKPITAQNDPNTYKYLKHLEQLQQQEKQQNIVLSEEELANYFKPYYTIPKDPKQTETYKSIQDILEAHEANKGKGYSHKIENVEEVKEEAATEATEEPVLPKQRRKKNNPTIHTVRARCFGRCRKRIRLRSRPYIRKIKKTIYTAE